MLDFARRMIGDLATNNVLRGSWAEQIVAFYLGIESWPGNWCYYDLRDADGRDTSVKHSVGPRPSFGVAMSRWAWDPALAQEDPSTEGWRGGETIPLQYWCHAYTFAWLEADTSAPPLDDVLNPDRWRFWVLSREEMHRAFGTLAQRTAGAQRLRSLKGDPVSGRELAGLVRAIPVTDEGDPPRRFDRWVSGRVGPPVPTATGVIPSSVADAAGESLSTNDAAAERRAALDRMVEIADEADMYERTVTPKRAR